MKLKKHQLSGDDWVRKPEELQNRTNMLTSIVDNGLSENMTRLLEFTIFTINAELTTAHWLSQASGQLNTVIDYYNT